jgi:hypothetical protein
MSQQHPVDKFLKIANASLEIQQVILKGARACLNNKAFAAGLKLAAEAVMDTANEFKAEFDAAERELRIAKHGEEYILEQEIEQKKRDIKNAQYEERMEAKETSSLKTEREKELDEKMEKMFGNTYARTRVDKTKQKSA